MGNKSLKCNECDEYYCTGCENLPSVNLNLFTEKKDKIKLNVNTLCEVVERQAKMPLLDRKLDLPIYVELSTSEAIRLIDNSVLTKKIIIATGNTYQVNTKSAEADIEFISSLVDELAERGIVFAGVKK